ncbi:MAG: histidinol-phosphate transaminase [Lachnospiraceae bacterium]|jgi:histidinol-phosphate aminotransferase
MSGFFIEKYRDLVPYTPGEQPKDTRYIKLNTNESPYPPHPDVFRAIEAVTGSLNLYSDPTCSALTGRLGDIYGLAPEQILVSNGSDEGLYFAFLAFCDENVPAAFPDITYGFYRVFAQFAGVPFREIPLQEDFTLNVNDYLGIGSTIFIANPNAPTGICFPVSDIERIVRSNPGNVVIVDEAYVDFGGETALPLLKGYKNLLIVRTFSKSRSMAGARLGFVMGNPELINDLNTVRYSINPYNVNSMTMAAAAAVLDNEEYTFTNCRKIIKIRNQTADSLKEMCFTVTDSSANFLFAAHHLLDGKELYLKLKEKGILVRHFDNPRINDYIRITIGTREQMDSLLAAITDILKEKRQ